MPGYRALRAAAVLLRARSSHLNTAAMERRNSRDCAAGPSYATARRGALPCCSWARISNLTLFNKGQRQVGRPQLPAPQDVTALRERAQGAWQGFWALADLLPARRDGRDGQDPPDDLQLQRRAALRVPGPDVRRGSRLQPAQRVYGPEQCSAQRHLPRDHVQAGRQVAQHARADAGRRRHHLCQARLRPGRHALLARRDVRLPGPKRRPQAKSGSRGGRAG